MSTALSIAAAVVTVFAVAVAIIAVLGWRRARTLKSALLAGAFAVFVLKAAFVTWSIFTLSDFAPAVLPVLVLDASILGLLYLALVKR